MAIMEKLQELSIPANTDPTQINDFLIVKPANRWIEEAYKRVDIEPLLDEKKTSNDRLH